MIKKRRKKSKNYFTQDTEDAIVLYNNTECSKIRSKIYEREIHYAFFKLTENIIHTFKFYHTEVEKLEHLQHEIITFLLSKIHLFDPGRGAKAYSYFGTIVKRWLILYNTKNYNKKVKKVPVDNLTKEGSTYIYSMKDVGKEKDELSEYIEIYVKHVTENIFDFNKKALYIYIREMVDVKTPKITKIADKLYEIFRSQYVFYLENGYTRF